MIAKMKRHSTWTAALVVAISAQHVDTADAQCTLTADLDGNGVVDGADLGLLLLQWGEECPATIDSVSPSSGPFYGGTDITITGFHIGSVQSVTIGGLPATDVYGIDPMTIVAKTPPSSQLGSMAVVVTTTGGSATLENGFTFIDPVPWATVLEVEPNPVVITDSELRERIITTGFPWRVRDNSSDIEMLLIPPGTFLMGCSPSEAYTCFGSEFPQHEVTISAPFYIGRYEVTQSQWTATMGSNPSYFTLSSNQVPGPQVPHRPVERVSWNMIQSFAAVTGLRLPTEAEWEYACRGGTTTAYNKPPNGTNLESQLLQLSWTNSNSLSQTRPVGQKLANMLGLHDTHGNVKELTADWFDADYYANSPPLNPTGPDSGTARVTRGGSYSDTWNQPHRASMRQATDPGETRSYIGFRAAKTP